MYLTTLLMTIMLALAIYSYPLGAPPGVCNSMSPNHNTNKSPAPSPYTIALSGTTYNCGGTIGVTLSGSPSFKGFLCQARPDLNTYSTVGSLTDPGIPVTSRNRCQEEASITHNNNDTRTSFNFDWTHSGTTNGSIYIVCTVVQTKLIYWEQVKSAVITYSGTGTC